MTDVGTTPVGAPTNQPDETPTHGDRLRELASVLDNLPAGLLPEGFNTQGNVLYVVADNQTEWLTKATMLGADVHESDVVGVPPAVRLRAGYWSITLIAAFGHGGEPIELDYQHG